MSAKQTKLLAQAAAEQWSHQRKLSPSHLRELINPLALHGLIDDALFGQHTALSLACRAGRSSLASALLRAGADPNRINGRLNAPLHEAVDCAATGGDAKDAIACLEHLVKAGADIQLPGAGGSALHALARASLAHVDIARWLISRGADPSALDKDAWTPLHRAIFSSNEAIMMALVEAGSDLSTPCQHNGKKLNAVELARVSEKRTGTTRLARLIEPAYTAMSERAALSQSVAMEPDAGGAQSAGKTRKIRV